MVLWLYANVIQTLSLKCVNFNDFSYFQCEHIVMHFYARMYVKRNIIIITPSEHIYHENYQAVTAYGGNGPDASSSGCTRKCFPSNSWKASTFVQVLTRYFPIIDHGVPYTIKTQQPKLVVYEPRDLFFKQLALQKRCSAPHKRVVLQAF